MFGYGSVWTWTALGADTKLICSWMVGNRDGVAARIFIQDLPGHLANRIQLTTDGHRAYLEAVDEAFGSDIDYAMLVKLYVADLERETRYSPRCLYTNAFREDRWRPERKAYLYVLGRAPEPCNAYAHAGIHSSDKRFLKETGEPHCGDLSALHVLQFRSDSLDASDHSRNGSRHHRSCLGSSRCRGSYSKNARV